MAFTPPDRPLSHLDQWVVVCDFYDPAHDPRYGLTKPEGFATEADAKRAANTAKTRLGKGKRRIRYAVAYPPVNMKRTEPYVVAFQ